MSSTCPRNRRRFSPLRPASRPATLDFWGRFSCWCSRHWLPVARRSWEVTCWSADACGHRQQAYNSCHNRHCPKCQAGERGKWFEDRERDLLPVEYFHVVFTLPSELGALALQNKASIYNLLFRATAETLTEVAAGWKDLKAKIGFFAILHTWGQKLDLHPHLHCVVPGGGISLDGSRWVSCPRGFFMPVKMLSRKFRGKFLALLKQSHQRGELTLAGSLAAYRSQVSFQPLALTFVWQGVGGLRQATLERTRAGVEVSGSLHASRGDRQSSVCSRSTEVKSRSVTKTIATVTVIGGSPFRQPSSSVAS